MDPMTRNDFLKIAMAVAAIPLVPAAPAAAAPAAAPLQPAPTEPPAPAELGAPISRRFREAVAAGRRGEVESLLAADPALALGRDERGRSMLVLAFLSGHAELATVLRPHLPELDLVEAVLVDDGERAGALARRLPGLVNEPHPLGGSAVHAAARFGRAGLLGPLLVAGADLNAPGSDPAGVTPLGLAARYGDPAVAEEMVDFMLGNGGDPTLAQGDGVPPLHAAAATGTAEMVRLLVFCGADPSARNAASETAEALARRLGRREIADLLARAERLPRRQRTSRYAYTLDGAPWKPVEAPPLPATVVQEYVVAAHGNVPRVRELLALYPGLPFTLPRWNELGIEAAAHMGNVDIARLQLDAGAPVSLPTAAMLGATALVRKLLAEDPARAHEPGAHNMPAIWYPAIGGGGPEQLEIARLLLDGGADANAEKRGQTALHWAARKGEVEMAELLLARGAEVNAQTKDKGETPLAQATRANQKAVADLLRGKGGR